MQITLPTCAFETNAVHLKLRTETEQAFSDAPNHNSSLVWGSGDADSVDWSDLPGSGSVSSAESGSSASSHPESVHEPVLHAPTDPRAHVCISISERLDILRAQRNQ